MHPVAQKLLEFGKRESLRQSACSYSALYQHVILLTLQMLMASSAGYGETYGQEKILRTFEAFLVAMDRNASQLKLTDVTATQFLNFFLEQHEGGVPSEPDVDDNSEPEGSL